MKSEDNMSESEIINFTRKMVIDHLHDHKKSLNRFAQDVEVLQPNLHVFVNGKGLSIKSLEKIWKYFNLKITQNKKRGIMK